LKKSKRMLSVSIGGYNDFRFELMNFSQLPNPSVVSWTFSDLQFFDLRLCSLLGEIALYWGDIQQLHITKTKFSIQSGKMLDQVLRVPQSFRVLEYLTIDATDIVADDALPVFTSLVHAASYLPVLYHCSLG
jgi:hypothetical protein